MYSNKILNTKGNITEKDLVEIENKYNFKFPQDFFSHYLKYNGGTLQKDIYKDEDGDEFVFNWFIPIKSESRNLETVLDLLWVDGTIPRWLIPFADDPGGDLYCFSIDEDDKGAIYYWSHEYDYGEDPEEHVYFLAGSLKEFIDAMTEDTE